MYKPSRKMLEKGKILNRMNHFYLYGTEYTFVLKDYDALWNRIAAQLNQESRYFRYKVFSDKPVMVIVGSGWRYELYRTAHLEDNVRYIGYFSDWEEFGTTPSMCDWMNQAQTIVEQTIVQMDPCAWVRDLPMKRHLTNGIGSRPEKWTAGPPQADLTREEAAQQKLEECYLADRMRLCGMAVMGGQSYASQNQIAENPMIAQRVQNNEALSAKKKEPPAEKPAEKPPEPVKKFCDKCGYETEPGSRFCSRCGAPVKKTIAEKKAEEKTMKKYPMFFVTEGGEALDPYVHVRLDANLNVIEEPRDHGFLMYRVKGITLKSRAKGASAFTTEYSSDSNENTVLYISDTRLVVVNREYNKNDAGKWRGYGLIEMGVSAALNAANRAAMKAKRGNTALAGQIRYEWISDLYYKRKQKMLEDEQLRVVYVDLNRTVWYVTLNLVKEVDSGVLANDIMRRAAAHRYAMLDKRDEELEAFLEKYRSGRARLPMSADPKKMSGDSFPVYYFATKGMPYQPDLE